MKILSKSILLSIVMSMTLASASAQPPRGHAPESTSNWQINIRQMDPQMSHEISNAMSQLNGSHADRGIIADIGKAVGLGLLGSAVDIVVSETHNLITYRDRQKQEWMKMIQKENRYTDSITNVKGLKDFYSQPSTLGALDPSDINFDGIEILGRRNGQNVLYVSCSIDRSKLDHMFHHSKFNLVVDSVVFYPMLCHLPNITANGIRIMNEIKKGDSKVVGDTIQRPGGNGYTLSDRKDLKIGIDLELSSSWINEAIQLHKNVGLGDFHFSIAVPDNVMEYSYSRKGVLAQANAIKDPMERERFLAQNEIKVEGDSFVVPRSYMPMADGTRMWGTGEYNIKVVVSEACQLNNEGEKSRNWRDDYKQLRKMQKHSGEVEEYFTTLWNQYGNNMVKTSYKTILNTTLQHFGLTQAAASANAQKAAMAAKAAAQGQGGAQSGAQPQGPSGAMPSAPMH